MFISILNGSPLPETLTRARPDLPDGHPKWQHIRPVVDRRPAFDRRLFSPGPDTFAVEGDAVSVTCQPVPRHDVATTRATAIMIIDGEATDRISSVRTPGMDAVYDAKREQMLEYFARKTANEATPNDAFPNLAAMIGIDGPDLDAVATLVRDRAASENARLAAIDVARRQAKSHISAAQTVEQIAAIVETAKAQIGAA